jgi:hypothetical protein
MSNCLQLLECEQEDSPPPLLLQYYGYTTRTDANGKEFKFLDLKVGPHKAAVDLMYTCTLCTCCNRHALEAYYLLG